MLLSIDQSLPYQNNFTGRRIAVVGVRAKTNQLEDLLPLVKTIQAALAEVRPGEIQMIG